MGHYSDFILGLFVLHIVGVQNAVPNKHKTLTALYAALQPERPSVIL